MHNSNRNRKCIGVNKRRPPTKWSATFEAFVGNFSQENFNSKFYLGFPLVNLCELLQSAMFPICLVFSKMRTPLKCQQFNICERCHVMWGGHNNLWGSKLFKSKRFCFVKCTSLLGNWDCAYLMRVALRPIQRVSRTFMFVLKHFTCTQHSWN